jgi:hypothetical protein
MKMQDIVAEPLEKPAHAQNAQAPAAASRRMKNKV